MHRPLLMACVVIALGLLLVAYRCDGPTVRPCVEGSVRAMFHPGSCEE